MKLNEEAVAEALCADEQVRKRMARDYELGSAEPLPPREFVDKVIDSFDQEPAEDPLVSRTNAEVFAAAVKALASNSRSWVVYLKNGDKLCDLLGGLKPAIAQGADPNAIADLLPGQTATRDARAILKWAKLLAALDTQGLAYYDGVIDLAETVKSNAASQNIRCPTNTSCCVSSGTSSTSHRRAGGAPRSGSW